MTKYCRDCKHYRSVWKLGGERCSSEKLCKDTYLAPITYYLKPSWKNRNNSCKDYEKK